MNPAYTRCERVLFHGWPGFSIYITLGSVHKQVSHFRALLMKLLLSKQVQLFSFQMKKGSVLWAQICPPGRHLKSRQVTTDSLPILSITVGMNRL